MLWNSLMKKPILMMGIIMMGLFIYDYRSNRIGNKSVFYRDAFTTWACKPVVAKLEKLTPSNWTYVCNKDNLKIMLNLSKDVQKINERAVIYREMANSLIYISKNSPEDNLERVPIIYLSITGTHYRVNAISSGKDILKLKNMQTTNFIQQHLQSVVKVKEIEL